jgi:hypothetical protein
MTKAAVVWLAPTTRSPPGSGSSRIDSAAARSASSTRCACSRSRRPSSVGVTPRAERTSSGRPHAASSSRICAETAGCERWRARAPEEMVPARATTRNVSNLRGSMPAIAHL